MISKNEQLKQLSDSKRFYSYCFLLCKSDLAQDLHQDYLIALSECDNWFDMDKQVFTNYSQNIIYGIFKKKADYKIQFEVFKDITIYEIEFQETSPKTECLAKGLDSLDWYERKMLEEYMLIPSARRLQEKLEFKVRREEIRRTVKRAKEKIFTDPNCLKCLNLL